jgi:hypothetical protein
VLNRISEQNFSRSRSVASATARSGERGASSAGFVASATSSQRGWSFWQQSQELIARYPGRTALGSLPDFSEAAGYYGLFAFLALFILPAIAVPSQFVPWFYLIGNLGALVGGIVAAVLLDKIGRKITVPSFYALAALGVLLLAAATYTRLALGVISLYFSQPICNRQLDF